MAGARRFQGFGVIGRPDGPLIWGTLRPTEAEAWAVYERHNPAVEGHPTEAQLVSVTMTVEPLKRS